MVLDDQVVIIGSFNFTGPTNSTNDDNIVILGDLETTDQTSVATQKRLAKYARKEIERIIKDHGTKVN